MTDEITATETTYETDNDTAEITLVNAGTAMLDSITTANDARIESYGFDATTDDAMVTIFNAEEDGTSLNDWLAEKDDSGALVNSGPFAINGIILRPSTRVDPVTGSRALRASTPSSSPSTVRPLSPSPTASPAPPPAS